MHGVQVPVQDCNTVGGEHDEPDHRPAGDVDDYVQAHPAVGPGTCLPFGHFLVN